MQAGTCIIFPSSSLRSAEQTGEERYESGPDQGDSAAGHELLHTLGLGAGIIVAGLRSAPVGAKPTSTGRRAPFQKVDGAPDTKACSECDHESLKDVYCAVKEIHSKS